MPAAPSTVASAAGPQWKRVCGMKGVAASSIGAASSGGGADRSAAVWLAQPPSASVAASSSVLSGSIA
jgi:hypothetical protein